MTHPQPTDSSGDKLPTIEQIEHLLHTFQPVPGYRFQVRMKSVPWLLNEDPQHHPDTHRILRLNHRLRLALVGLTTALAVLVGFLINPAVQNLTYVLLGLQEPEVAEEAEAGPAVAISLEVDSGLTVGDAPTVTAALSDHVGYPVKTPGLIPADFKMVTAFASDSSGFVGLAYAGPEGDGLILNQHWPRFGSNIISLGTVDAAAARQIVTIQNYSAEYVAGAWNPALIVHGEVLVAARAYDLEAAWQTGGPVQQLRWTSGEVRFELLYFGESLGMADLVAIASSLFE